MKPYFFILILSVFLLANYYVFYKAWVMMPPSFIARFLLISVSVILVSATFIFFAFNQYLPVSVASVFYKVGTSWMCIFIYVLIFNLLRDLLGVTCLIPQSTFDYYAKGSWIGFGVMLAFVFILMLFGYLKYEHKSRVELPLSIEKNFGKQDSLRIVAISDLHLGYSIGKDELDNWVKLINEEKPDIVIIAGDIIDNSVRPLNEGGFASSFKNIKAPLGVYACLGNHEYISGISESIRFIEDAGIILLKDSSVLIDSSFYLVGRDDKTNLRRKPLADLTNGLDKTKSIILLDHQPYHLEEAEQNGIDFQFSGHTHQGQIWPVSLITKWIYEQPHGSVKKGNTNVYVSSGLGIWGGKFRIGTQSEYVVINMKKK